MGICYLMQKGGGGGGLNFKVVPNPQPSNPKENTIWVNTDTEITGWYFGAGEPNIYAIEPISAEDAHYLICPHKLSEGDIVNFTIPATVSGIYEALRIFDGSRFWYVRNANGGAITGWNAGTKIGLRITETDYPVGGWGTADADGSALLLAWDSYLHEEGMVWITTGTSSPVAFNPLKKNSIMVYPISAKQRISGAWVDKPAQSYQGSEWHDWIIYIYNLGWDAASGLKTASGNGAPNISIGTSNGYLVLSRYTNWNSWAYAVTNETFDLTDVTTIYCETGEMGGSSGGSVNFGVSQSGAGTPVASVSMTASNTVYSLNVASLKGKYNVGFFGWNSSSFDQDWRWSTNQIKAIWY